MMVEVRVVWALKELLLVREGGGAWSGRGEELGTKENAEEDSEGAGGGVVIEDSETGVEEGGIELGVEDGDWLSGSGVLKTR